MNFCTQSPILEALRERKSASVFGMSFGTRTAFLAHAQMPVLYVCGDVVSGKNAFKQMSAILGEQVYFLPPLEDNIVYSRTYSQDNTLTRIRTLDALQTGKARVVVTCIQAICGKYPRPEVFAQNILHVQKDQNLDPQKLAQMLRHAGYKREPNVTAMGQYALRGDILDVYPPYSPNPIRLDFFDIMLESISFFDPHTQNKLQELQEFRILPATTLFLSRTGAQTATQKMRSDYNGKLPFSYDARIKNIMEEVEERLLSGERDFALSWIEPYVHDLCHISEYLHKDCIVAFDDTKQLTDMLKAQLKEYHARCKELILRGEILPAFFDALFDYDKALAFAQTKIAFHKVISQNNLFAPQAVFDAQSVPLARYGKDGDSLAFDIGLWIRQGYNVYLYCGSKEKAESVCQHMQARNCNCVLRDQPTVEKIAQALPQELPYGFIFKHDMVVALGSEELAIKPKLLVPKKNVADLMSQIQTGDLVVHFFHGIGKFEKTVMMDGQEYFLINYQGGDTLYVPSQNMDSLSKYTGSTEKARISKLGGSDFAKIKAKTRNSVKVLAYNLLEMYALRATQKSLKVDYDEQLLSDFASNFPYTETPDQLSAIADIKSDFDAGKKMDRLLCGDVGFGKTEVALRAAFMAMMCGYQVAFLAPTTILAEQHFNTANARLKQYGFVVECLSRFRSKAEIEDILHRLRQGKVNLVCGTHRLLSKDVDFENLGLLILDEEQRFGVNDKEKLRAKKEKVHVLTMSATPIPRTLNMSLSGIKDISLLDTPPEGRLETLTYVSEYSDALVMDALNRELNRGGQAFVLYNNVQSIDKMHAKLQELLPHARIIVAHGQMHESQLERAVTSFYEGKADIMLCTTIIENGIDLPRANTLIVLDSVRLGLSQMHQLRGRVGRSNRLAYVYFTYNNYIPTENAQRRLETICQFCEFGSGFKIAMADMEIRGAGVLFGAEQHGHMEKVGYDMYIKLLNQAIKELKGESYSIEMETKIHTDLPAFIDRQYIEDDDSRLRVLSRISRLKTLEDKDKLQQNLLEVYGQPPKEVEHLLQTALIKNLAHTHGACVAVYKRAECSLQFLKPADLSAQLLEKVTQFGSRCVLNFSKMPIITFEGAKARQNMLEFLTA